MLDKPARNRVKSGGLAPWQVRRATQLLLSENPSDHGLDTVACACGLSRSHFGRAFKASAGVSPHQWLLRQHVLRAAEMLERTDDSISMIAAKCGFADQSHLSRFFQATLGSSPANWRRQRRSRDFADDTIQLQKSPFVAFKYQPFTQEQRRAMAVLVLIWLCASTDADSVEPF